MDEQEPNKQLETTDKDNWIASSLIDKVMAFSAPGSSIFLDERAARTMP